MGRQDEEDGNPGGRRAPVRRGRWLAAALFLLSSFGVASLFSGPGGFVRIRNLEAELAEVNDHNFDLVQSAHRLQSQIDRLHVDEGEIERLARRHRLVRDGETLYQFGDDTRRRERTPVAAKSRDR
ncbi:septum formation initiator family protein [bacterium]|nr:septum formation initiator family protein [bacterium]